MPIYATTVGMSIGVCLTLSLLYGYVGLRFKKYREHNVTFALFALGYAGTLWSEVAYHTSMDLDAYVRLLRVDAIFVAWMFVALMWYVASFTNFYPRLFLWLMTVVFVVVGLVNLFSPTMIFAEIIDVSPAELPWGETVMHLNAVGGLWTTVAFLAQIVLMVFIVVASVVQYRRGERRESKVIFIGMSWLLVVMTYEILSVMGMFSFIPIAETGFLGLALAAAVWRANVYMEDEAGLQAYKASLEQEMEQRTAEIRAMQQQLVEQAQVSAVADERSRLARDLHDAVTQTLYSATLIAEALPNVWERDPSQGRANLIKLRQLVRGALAEMRTLLFELRPNSLTQVSLEVLLTQLADSFTGRTRTPVTLKLESSGPVSAEVRVNLYRIVQESFNNISKHANATDVTLTLRESPDEVLMTIRDDGRGFESDEALQPHLGMEIMAERAASVGASWHVESDVGKGTQVTFFWSHQPEEAPFSEEQDSSWNSQTAYVS